MLLIGSLFMFILEAADIKVNFYLGCYCVDVISRKSGRIIKILFLEVVIEVNVIFIGNIQINS
jgi:hypothetical protein